jgi:hypothetical protein
MEATPAETSRLDSPLQNNPKQSIPDQPKITLRKLGSLTVPYTVSDKVVPSE